MKQRAHSIDDLIEHIYNDTEDLETSEGDGVECISIENLEAILSKFLDTKIKLIKQ